MSASSTHASDKTRKNRGRIELTAALCAAALAVFLGLGGCSRMGRLTRVEPISPLPAPQEAESAGVPSDSAPVTRSEQIREQRFYALFGDTALGFKPGTRDMGRRYLGRLRHGYVADTLNVFVLGDNRPSYRSSILRPYTVPLRGIMTLNPVNWLRAIAYAPLALAYGTVPDAKLWRDLPSLISRHPTYGREEEVVSAMLAKLDSIRARGQTVAAVINSGDLVKDGRFPAQWERFLDIVRPLAQQVPYFPIAGNHERTDDSLGLENWHAATGLPIASDRLYYCFDSADGWVRFLALDSNPMTDPKNYWSREVEVKYSDEQIDWLVARLKEHTGPALVFLHHPPFSLGFHRTEWETDPVLQERRARMVRIMREAGLSVLVAGHEHAYERALLTCGDAVLIVLTSGGAGSPLHDIPLGDIAAKLFAAYEVEGCEFRPENVFASEVFHYIHMRFWFGGGEFFTYAVDAQGKSTEIDHVLVDLKRFGVPQIDQEKIPILDQGGPKQAPPSEETPLKDIAVDQKSDTTEKSKPLEQPPPTRNRPRRR